MTDHWSLWILVFLLLLVGCENPDGSSFTVEKRDGVRYAINRGSNVWADSTAAPTQFENKRTYGTQDGPKKTLLGRITDVAVDSDGTVYVLDGDGPRLVAFTPEGSVLWSVARSGNGPGELKRPTGLVKGPENRLFVANNVGRTLDVWTTDGTFVKRQTFDNSEIRFFLLAGHIGDRLVGSEPVPSKKTQLIRVIDPATGDLAQSFPLDLSIDLPVGVKSPTTIIGDHVVASGVAEYTLSWYSPEGTLSRRITRDTPFPMEPAEVKTKDGRTMAINYSQLPTPVQLASGHLLVTASWATNVDDPSAYHRRSLNDNAEELKPATVIDVFEPNGRYVGSLKWDDRWAPPMGTPQTVGPDGTLYTTTDEPFPHVRRYEVTVQTR